MRVGLWIPGSRKRGARPETRCGAASLKNNTPRTATAYSMLLLLEGFPAELSCGRFLGLVSKEFSCRIFPDLCLWRDWSKGRTRRTLIVERSGLGMPIWCSACLGMSLRYGVRGRKKRAAALNKQRSTVTCRCNPRPTSMSWLKLSWRDMGPVGGRLAGNLLLHIRMTHGHTHSQCNPGKNKNKKKSRRKQR